MEAKCLLSNFLAIPFSRKWNQVQQQLLFAKVSRQIFWEMRPSPFTVLIADKFTFHGAYLKENVGPAVHENVGTACSPWKRGNCLQSMFVLAYLSTLVYICLVYMRKFTDLFKHFLFVLFSTSLSHFLNLPGLIFFLCRDGLFPA